MSIFQENHDLARRLRVLTKALRTAGFTYISATLDIHDSLSLDDWGGPGTSYNTFNGVHVAGGPTLRTAIHTILRHINEDDYYQFRCFDDSSYNGCIRLFIDVNRNHYEISEFYQYLEDAEDTFCDEGNIPAREETVDEEQ